ASVPNVKNLIRTINSQTDDLTAVMLLGHIPVPYSGNFYADGHSENHWGAWAADVFYADLDGTWTDNEVANLSAAFPRNHNNPNDGKYDQSALPSSADLQIGRVDFYDLPAFAQSEFDLMRQYLRKLHLFKTGQLEVRRTALMDDNLGSVLGAPAASAYRNFAPMFGAENIVLGDYFTNMTDSSYLWSYGAGGGSHVSAAGVGNTDDFANSNLKNIFTMLCGSQFGDWDNTNNFLRAPLAGAGWTLTSCWVGNPPWTLHTMGQGYHLGHSLQQTQNASTNDYDRGPQLVHTSLLGDPTLRLHSIKMPQNVTAVATENSIEINWSASADSEVLGYYIYRQNPQNLQFERLTFELLADLNFTDNNPHEYANDYLVKAVKLEQSGSGTYYNLSLGAAATAEFLTPVFECCPERLTRPTWSVYPNPNQGEMTIQSAGIGEYVKSPSVKEQPVRIYNYIGQLQREFFPDTKTNWTLKLPKGVYFIRWQEQVEQVIVQ
ncbi:MAG: T9SS type A sorting domain-containing protein, partial [Saprospiraceae bacterium]